MVKIVYSYNYMNTNNSVLTSRECIIDRVEFPDIVESSTCIYAKVNIFNLIKSTF